MRALIAVALLVSFTAVAGDAPKRSSLVPEPSPAPLVKGEPGAPPEAEPSATPGWYKWVGLGAGLTVVTVVAAVIGVVVSQQRGPIPVPRGEPTF